MAKRNKKQSKSRLLKIEALEQRQLLASGFTAAQGQEFSNIVHPNGQTYDQILLKSSSIQVINDPGQITRISFIDASGDIVQAEFSGHGTLGISLDGFSGPADPTGYVQPGIQYVKGLASFTIEGSASDSNLTIYTVGSATPGVNVNLFDSTHTGGNHTAEVQRITIVADPANPFGSTFGGIRAGNAIFTGSTGPVGISAQNVQVQNVVTIGDIDATGTATPTLIFGQSSQFGSVTVAGGDLLSTNGKPINNNDSYLYQVNLAAGTTSDGTTIPASTGPLPSWTGVDPIKAQTKIFALTTGVDSIVGTGGVDNVNGSIGGATATLTALDNIDLAGGTDSLTINDVNGSTPLPGGITIKNTEILNFASAGAATIDTSTATITGLTTLNVLASTGADNITAGAGQAVTVFDTAGTVTLTGGSTQTVTTAGGLALSKATGAIVATDTAQGMVNSTINGGTTVALSTTADTTAGNSGTITIGGTAVPTGAVTVTSKLIADTSAAPVDRAGGLIAITGGTTVTVNETGSGTVLAAGGVNKTITQSAVSVTGSTATTAVTVTQSAPTGAATTVAAVAATTEVATVTFGAVVAGETITLAGLTYTVPTGGDAKAAAAAFANLSNGAIAGYTSSAAGGAGSNVVTFTATSAGTATDIVAGGTNATTAVSIVQGVASGSASGRIGIVNGAVTIADAAGAGDTIASVSLSNYANSTVTSDALTSLSLTATSGQGVGTLGVVNGTATTLDLTLNRLGGTNTITLPTYTSLKVHTTGTDSTVANISAAAAKSLTVDGDKALTLTTAAGLGVLQTISVSGSAGLTVSAGLAGTVTDINASATSGNVRVDVLNPTTTSYSGGTGNDRVQIALAPTKAISGGTGGVDTLVVNVAAATFANPSANTFISGFETLQLGAAADGSYDATGFTTVTNGAVAAAVTYSNVAAGTPLTISATPGFATTYTLKDATGSTDALTLNVAGGASPTVNAAGIEAVTLNITGTTGTSSVTLVDTAATTLTLTGARPLTLTNSGNTALTTINASAYTGALGTVTTPLVMSPVTATGSTATTITGGTAADVISANQSGTATNADVLIGGGGNDILIANAGLNTLTGGTGNDTFVVQVPTANVNTYATITDATIGDVIRLADSGDLGAERFNATKVNLAATAVFQDYANAVVAAGADARSVTAGGSGAYIGWFQFNGDTYIVESRHNGLPAGTPSFQNGTDIVVKITGLVDLSNTTVVETSVGSFPEIIIR